MTEQPTFCLSIVVPVYNEAASLEALVGELDAVLARYPRHEVVFVDDGSTDKTPLVLGEIVAARPAFRAVILARNFGKEIALSAGLAHTTGDAVVFIDGDLQHPPSLIPEFVRRWQDGFDVVVGVRDKTESKSFLRRFGSWVYHGVMRRLGDGSSLRGETDFRLINKSVRDAVLSVTERQRLFRGVVNWVGFRRTTIDFSSPARFAGQPSYSFRKLWTLALDSFLSHSQFPLRLVFYLGCFALCLSTAGLLWMNLAEFLVNARWQYTPLAKALVFNTALVAVLQISVGVVGLYVSKIYHEVVGRPLFVVRTILSGTRHST